MLNSLYRFWVSVRVPLPLSHIAWRSGVFFGAFLLISLAVVYGWIWAKLPLGWWTTALAIAVPFGLALILPRWTSWLVGPFSILCAQVCSRIRRGRAFGVYIRRYLKMERDRGGVYSVHQTSYPFIQYGPRLTGREAMEAGISEFVEMYDRILSGEFPDLQVLRVKLGFLGRERFPRGARFFEEPTPVTFKLLRWYAQRELDARARHLGISQKPLYVEPTAAMVDIPVAAIQEAKDMLEPVLRRLQSCARGSITS